MDAFEVYKYYMALKLHFTTDKYDVIKQKGKVKASRQAFAKRSDLFAINKIAKTYSDQEVANFLIANFVSGDRWGGVFDADARETYLSWKKRIESLSYNFEKDLDNLLLEIEQQNIDKETIFDCQKSEHPYILRAFLRKTITIETLLILDHLLNLVDKFDKEIDEQLVWPDVSRMLKKYKPFVKIKLEKYDAIFRRRFGYCGGES